MTHYERLYLILRPARGKAGGHARLEQRGAPIQMSLFLHGLEGRCRLRVLLLSSPEPQGAVIDLGTLETNPHGQGALAVTGVRLPGSAPLSSCHTLAVCMDWPDNQLVMAASIGECAPASRWDIQAAVDRYLSVPVSTPEPPPEESPQLSDVQEEEKTLPPEKNVLPCPVFCPGLDDLRPLLWPEPLKDLKPYFDLMPPCAPFDAPGWRFVRAPLPKGGPGPVCYIGVRPLDGCVTEAAYALPAVGCTPPEGLESYRLETGRHQKRYWVLRTGH